MIKTRGNSKKDRIAKRASYRFHFKNKDMDFYLMAATVNVSHHGASMGEIMYAANRIKENDPDSWAHEWLALGRRCEERADEAVERGNTATAAIQYLHAYTYYRIGIIGISTFSEQRDETYHRLVSCFQRAATYLEAHIEPIQVPWVRGDDELLMPGYFMSPDNSGMKRPTIIILNGGEMYPEDQYFWGGATALQRGFNVITLAYEGSRAPPVLYPDLPALDPAEVMVAPGFHKFIVDYAVNRPETDSEHLAAIGFSSGAYQVMHQASFDDRIEAIVLAAPLYDLNALLTEEIPSALQKAPEFIFKALTGLAAKVNAFTRVSLEHAVDASRVSSMKELMDLSRRIPPVDPKSISCPVLCLVGDGDSEEQMRQCYDFYEQVSSNTKEMRVFTQEDGASMHCQIDNLSLLEQIAFDWLNDVLQRE
ncbi:MAG: alpha/beta hydrolase family protein [Candidatus Thorarchaeota archaeon]